MALGACPDREELEVAHRSEVLKGDITQIEVDAIVNAASASMTRPSNCTCISCSNCGLGLDRPPLRW